MTLAWMVHGVVAPGLTPPPDAPPHDVLAAGPVAALVSRVDLGRDAACDAAEALRHDAILTAWARVGDVAPARFGAVAADPARAAALVADDAARHLAALARVAGAVEFGLRLLAEADPAPASPPPGLNFLRAQAFARDAVRDAAAARAEAARAVLAPLVALARAHLARRPPPKVEGPRRLADLALLVARDRVADLLRAAADARPPEGLRLSLSGPFAPYSFAAPPPEEPAR